MKNPYEVLGVDPKASFEEIQTAFRRASSAAHPDRNGGNTDRQAELNAAWEVLKDREARARYDAGEEQLNPHHLRVAAIEMLLQFYDEAVKTFEPGNLMHGLEDCCQKMLANQEKELAKARRILSKMQRWAGAVKRKDGELGFFEARRAEHQAGIEQNIKQMERSILVIQLAQKTLEEDFENGFIEPVSDGFNLIRPGQVLFVDKRHSAPTPPQPPRPPEPPDNFGWFFDPTRW